MFRRRTIQVFETALLAACMMAPLGGCGKSAATVQTDARGLKALGIVYGKYVGAHNGRRPGDEVDLRQYVSAKESNLLKQLSVQDPTKLFASPRDGRPLTVVYGTNPITEPNPIVGYESQPTDGKRWVVWTTGSVMELDEAEFQKYKPVL